MYLKFSEIVLVGDRPARDNDVAVNVIIHLGERVLVCFPESGEAYGWLYLDADGRACVIPRYWNESDALCAKDWRK